MHKYEHVVVISTSNILGFSKAKEKLIGNLIKNNNNVLFLAKNFTSITSDNLISVDYLPLKELLNHPKVDLLINFGGANTV